MTIEKCKTCDHYDSEKSMPRNWLYCKFKCDELIKYETKRMAEYMAWLKRKEE